MTTKQKLNKLLTDSCDFLSDITLYDDIIKDLESLQIIKKYIQQFHLPANEDRVEYIDSISFELSTDALTKEELEDYNKLKEWLRND